MPNQPRVKSKGAFAAGLEPLLVPIESVKLDKRNARRHPMANLEALKRSLETYGQRKPIVVNKATGQIEAGNGLWTAALALGWTHIAAIQVEDDKARAAAYALMDNQSALLAEWDKLTLKELLVELDAAHVEIPSTGFDDAMLQELLDWSPRKQLPTASKDDELVVWSLVLSRQQNEMVTRRLAEISAVQHFTENEQVEALCWKLGQPD